MDRTRSQTPTNRAGGDPIQWSSGEMKPASPLSDLLRRVARQDRAAFATLYDATAAKLFGLVFRMVRQRDVAEDILQDVYARIWERAGDFDERKGSAMAWMGTIARNRAFDELRRSRSQPMPATSASEGPETASEDISPLEALEQSEDLERLMGCLDKLGGERRDAVLLAYRDGFSGDDLSRRFSRPVGTIKTWLFRSLVQLRKCLDQ